jgi:hypothetical protein
MLVLSDTSRRKATFTTEILIGSLSILGFSKLVPSTISEERPISAIDVTVCNLVRKNYNPKSDGKSAAKHPQPDTIVIDSDSDGGNTAKRARPNVFNPDFEDESASIHSPEDFEGHIRIRVGVARLPRMSEGKMLMRQVVLSGISKR